MVVGGREKFVAAIAACVGMNEFNRLYACAVTAGLWIDGFVAARAVDFCVNAGELNAAGNLFRLTEKPTAFAFNAMIRGCSTGVALEQALRLLRCMVRRGLYPDKYTLPFVLRAAGRSSAGEGEQLHSLLIKHGLGKDLHVQTSLLHMYGEIRGLDKARQVFDEMPKRGSVTWNAIISAYAKAGEDPLEGIALFALMIATEEVDFNEDTVVAVFQCCAGMGYLVFGKGVHGFMIRRWRGRWSVQMRSSFVRMYMKCGSLGSATKVFDEMPERDVVAWTTMISGLAEHGEGAAALGLFRKMVEQGLRPDQVTLTCLLQACSHSGLVQEGLELFMEMALSGGAAPRVEHYGAVVDLLGRAGMVEQATRLVKALPLVPNRVVLGSLHPSLLQNEEDKEAEVLLDGEEFFVEISNALARQGKWDEVEKMRLAMAEKGLRKTPAISFLHILQP